MIGESFEGTESDCDLGDCTIQQSGKPPVKSPKPVVFGGFFHAVNNARVFGWNLQNKNLVFKMLIVVFYVLVKIVFNTYIFIKILLFISFV